MKLHPADGLILQKQDKLQLQPLTEDGCMTLTGILKSLIGCHRHIVVTCHTDNSQQDVRCIQNFGRQCLLSRRKFAVSVSSSKQLMFVPLFIHLQSPAYKQLQLSTFDGQLFQYI